MDFENSLNRGKIKKVMPDKIRATSLFKSSSQAVQTAKSIPISVTTSKTILRELYEGFREFCEGIGYLHGFKFLDHESIGFFLKDILEEESVYYKFDRYRKLRNGINYYGDDIEPETIHEAVNEIPELIHSIKKHTDKFYP